MDGSSIDGGLGEGDRSTMQRRGSTHVGELSTARPSETSHSPEQFQVVQKERSSFWACDRKREVPQSPCAPTNTRNKDKWDIQYDPRSVRIQEKRNQRECTVGTHLRRFPSSSKSNYHRSRTHCRCQCAALDPPSRR